MSVRITVDLSALERRFSEERNRDRQEEFAMRAEEGMREYVPVEEGALRGSAKVSSDFRAGEIVWSTPYAAKHYYVPMAHTQAGTTDHWDQAFWAEHAGDMEAYAAELMEE
ncbi:hypothetical protein GMI70_06920 [Eggerthellaceae bacterium zg-893]|nr:hypothetical protein [Eggerthellaceae bacterium zg-893]